MKLSNRAFDAAVADDDDDDLVSFLTGFCRSWSRGSKEVAMLYGEGLRDVVQVMHKDEDARYMQIRLHAGDHETSITQYATFHPQIQATPHVMEDTLTSYMRTP